MMDGEDLFSVCTEFAVEAHGLEEMVNGMLTKGMGAKTILDLTFNILDSKLNTGKLKEILLNKKYGGFTLSDDYKDFLKSFREYKSVGEGNVPLHRNAKFIYEYAKTKDLDIDEALELASSNKYCKLVIYKIPFHRDYRITDYDGLESLEILEKFVG